MFSTISTTNLFETIRKFIRMGRYKTYTQKQRFACDDQLENRIKKISF